MQRFSNWLAEVGEEEVAGIMALKANYSRVSMCVKMMPCQF